MSRSLVGLVVLLAACTARIRNTDTPRRPNVVLILADDLGWRDLGCTGSTFYETPAIDHLAAQGMRFTQAYAACSVCSPTRASILTGKYPARLHLTNYLAAYRRGSLLPPPSIQSLPSEEITLAEAFRAAGYRTAIAGKWHLGRKGSLPSDHGFDVTIGADARGTIGPDDDPHFARFLSTKATEFLEESKDRPFFLYLSLYSVHVDLKTLPPLEKKYRDRRAAIDSHETVRDVEAGPGFRARAVQDDPDYAGMVEEMDIAVDHVLREIDRIDRARDTIVLFTSDNGGLSTAEGSPTSNFPLRAGKGWNYEGGLRVPLIVRVPGRVVAGSICDVPVISNDLYPTLLELAGVPIPPSQPVDAQSLATLLLNAGGIPERPLFWHYPHYSDQGGRPSGAIRVGNAKLVEFYEDARVELYDLASDPGEQHDLSAAEPARADQLRKDLAAWRLAVDAQMPTPNPKPCDPFGPEAVPSPEKTPGRK
ncbi:MAG: sulfatase [Planctomycetes bacterium]|nr:sulfatase [Planctomycetota bacterium]